MKPIEFPEQTVVYAKDQPQYLPLPAMVDNNNNGMVISCWKPSFRDRLRVLFGAKLWVSLMMFGKPLTPSKFSFKKSDHIIIVND